MGDPTPTLALVNEDTCLAPLPIVFPLITPSHLLNEFRVFFGWGGFPQIANPPSGNQNAFLFFTILMRHGFFFFTPNNATPLIP